MHEQFILPPHPSTVLALSIHITALIICGIVFLRELGSLISRKEHLFMDITHTHTHTHTHIYIYIYINNYYCTVWAPMLGEATSRVTRGSNNSHIYNYQTKLL